MDALEIHTRISPRRSFLVVTLAGAVVVAGSACSKSAPDGHAPYVEPIRLAGATPASDAGPVARSRRRSPSEFAQLQSAIRRFASDRAGRLPLSLSELTTERSPDGDRYLASIPNDVWGRPYSYAVVSARLGSYDLRSYGPDTLPDTPDDIVAEAKPVPVH